VSLANHPAMLAVRPEPAAGTEIFPYLHMQGVKYGYAELRAPWAYRLELTGQHWCYVVRSGSCWFEPSTDPKEGILLAAGDVLGVTHDIPHSLRDRAETHLPESPEALPLAFTPPRSEGTTSTTSLFVGSIPCRSDPLSEFYPTLFHVPADGSRESRRIANFFRIIEDELADNGPGSSSVVRRLSELIVVEFLRVTMRRLSDINPVWLRGLADAHIARLVGQLHADLARRWTYESMSRAAGLSRSALDRRFRAVLGQPPKAYLLRLRMRRAAAALADGRKSVAEIAAAVGYESEVSFHRAFRRALGVTPGACRQLLGSRPPSD
jgi:AraC-like DNA-binding protein